MAHFTFTDAYVSINSVVLSDHVRSVSLTYEAEVLDDSTMGVGGTRSHRAGLKNWTVDVEFLSDEAAAEVGATLFPLVGAAAFPVIIKPTSDAISSTNPAYTGNAILASLPVLSGQVGDLAVSNARFQSAGALDRDITP